MLSARKQVRIMNLGDIVTPVLTKTLKAFTTLISGKKPGSNPDEIGRLIGGVLQNKNNMQLINDFKLGQISDGEFTTRMIEALAIATGVVLTENEFNIAWNEMNPKLEEFAPLLKQAIEYNGYDQQIILISFTNPKDIKHLINELTRGKIDFRVENDQLVEIAGIELYTSYAAKQTKAQLIEAAIKRLNAKANPSSPLAASMSNVISREEAKDPELMDILYIRGVNSLDDPVLKANLDSTNQEVDKIAGKFFVDVVIWMKKENTLIDVLNNQFEATMRVASVYI